jgi:phosphoglycolate phosphatase
MDLLFDLDGTLTDPVTGITRCIRHALGQLGRDAPAEAALARFVGPPLRGTFAELLSAAPDDDLVTRAIFHYRERFVEVGMFENFVYPDVEPGLERLAALGHRLWVVTSKPTVYARRIAEHFGFAGTFRGIRGSELDGRNTDKVDLVRLVLVEEGLVPHGTWMIGDRAQDVRGGRANGTRTAGVLWGYGGPDELQTAGPDLLAASMDELVAGVSRAPAA